MSQKKVDIPEVGPVTLAKRRGAKNIRLTIQPDGMIRVSLPTWLPYASAILFTQNRAAWIARNRAHRPADLVNGSLIGKNHRLEFKPQQKISKPTFRLSKDRVTVLSNYPIDHPTSQAIAVKACERALRHETDDLLHDRARHLARAHKLSFRDFKSRKLKSRWGSCSSEKVITINYYLVQLPWHLIDYVLIHELVHTEHQNHSSDFWLLFERLLPDAKALRREIKSYQPILLPN